MEQHSSSHFSSDLFYQTFYLKRENITVSCCYSFRTPAEQKELISFTVAGITGPVPQCIPHADLVRQCRLIHANITSENMVAGYNYLAGKAIQYFAVKNIFRNQSVSCFRNPEDAQGGLFYHFAHWQPAF